MNQEINIQRQYYANTANLYDKIHNNQEQEHILGLHLLASYIEFYQIRSVLDVGAGTGRTILWLKRRFPNLIIKGIEPVKELREQGYIKGILESELVDGDGCNLPFPDNSVDLVCEFAVLHHVKKPETVVQEMSRVASKMICISDCNFMGQGIPPLRLLKYFIFSLGLWKVADWFKTKGKGYTISEEDGLAYSYSVYQNLSTIDNYWQQLRIMNTNGDSDHHLGQIFSAAHLLVIAFDKK
ncbi:class I SAM-dependent methyltransferase [Okeanomitos corallinicola TIOX110]|uniref:Class I SAM-dependent methyltransferase n=1 Tax=Okeanomitos corallinicola TIOX110 TaxID=3133117 RepID=A0ABZ2UVY0_9CYAN